MGVDQILNAVIAFADRHERAINFLSGAWFVFSTASWMPFFPFPEIPYVTDRNFWVSSAIWNTVWWGFAHPVISNHRKKLEAANAQDGPSDPPGA